VTTAASQFTTLFDNHTLNVIERMRLKPIRRLTNRSRGEHLSGKGGSSTDFADYRDYAAGDDLRYVDWNIFARLRRPYIKQFQHEEEMHVVVLVDASTSMLFDDKLLRARQLAAAFGIMGLLNVERVSAYAIHSRQGQPWMLPPGSGRTRIRQLLGFLEQVEGGGDTPIEKAIETMLRFHRGRGVAILLSDFLTFGDLGRPMNLLFSSGLEVWGIQILAESEINPNVQGDLRFVDSESQETLDITNASELLNVYQDQRLWLQQNLDTMCRSRQGRFLSVNSASSLTSILFDQLCRQGWILR
jgi:Mg-chelatase subunit ChlD